MRKIDIVILYEHAARELDVACALAATLKQEYKMSVEIVQWPVGFPIAVSRFQPRLAVLPYCYSDEIYRLLLAFWRKSVFLNLSWEQLFYVGNKKSKTPRGDFALKHVIHHSWSDQFAEFLMDLGVPEEHIFLNGQPAYALYDEPYNHYFASRADLAVRYHLDSSSRWVFFPENYNWAFYPESQINQIAREGQSTDDIQLMRDYCERSLVEVLHWCAAAASRDQIEVILRPRPSTSLADFFAVVNCILPEIPARLHILKQESVREWILASDVVVSSHSTSLIEAAVAGKYASIIAPYQIPPQLHVDWHNLLPHIKTQKDFLKIIKSDSSQEHELEKWARRTMMGHGDAIHNLAEFQAKLVAGEINVPAALPREIIASWFKIIPSAWIWCIYRRLKLFFHYPATLGIEPEYIKDYFSRREIQKRIHKWMGVLSVKKQ